MAGILIVMNSYFHDLAVALLAANLFVAWFYLRGFKDGSVSAVAPRFVRYMRRITNYTLVWILIGGAIRAWFFMDYEWNPAVGRGQVPALAVKHVLLFSIVIYGLIIQKRVFAKTAANNVKDSS